MKKLLAAAALASGVALSTTACGPANYASAQYCVDQFGNVEPAYYCNGSGLYGGHQYFLFVGSVGGHSYHVGQRIGGSYFSGGQRINPSNGTARAKAGLPFSGSVKNGGSVSKPASPGVSPGFGSSSKTSGGSSSRVGGSSTFGGSKSGGFSSGGSRSGGGFSFGGRK